MRAPFYLPPALALVALLGCPENRPEPAPSAECLSAADCAPGEVCVAETCEPVAPEGNEQDSGNANNSSSSGTDSGHIDSNNWQINITEPNNESGHFAALAITLKAEVVPPQNHDSTIEDIRVEWRDANGNVLHTGHDNESGQSSFSQVFDAGHHRFEVRAVGLTADEPVLATDEVRIYVCESGDLLDFSTTLAESDWHIHIGDNNNNSGDERNIWHEDEYLELTTTVSQHTSLINLSKTFIPGDLLLRFRMNMGTCAEGVVPCNGARQVADGLSLSIYDLETAEQMIGLLENHTRPGGGLGYMMMPSLVDGTEPPPVDAIHLQFDAHYNHTSRGHHHDDPTSEPHIQLHLNGSHDNDLDPDPDNEVSLWAEIPELVDNQWHDMMIEIKDSLLRVHRDGEVLLEGTVPEFAFKGGFLVLSATTGAVGMSQRIDDLEFLENCPYQAP